MLDLSLPPVQLTGFVGRQREVAELVRLVAGTRLLTLTGAGGSGKTRLAAEVAARRTGDEALGWVELAGLSDPALVAQQVAEQLGVREERTDAAARSLVERLGARPCLLVLDNCEHVVDAAARLVDALLRGCPGLRVLATSREPLGIAGERAWLVPPLDGGDAVRLFVERAQDAQPSFALGPHNAAAVAEICRRLDGLPLAIELAAARVRVLPPEQIAARLDDAFRVLGPGARTAIPRHQTLRATIDWSYALLAPDEQHLLDRLAPFAGGFTLEAAEAVCGGDDVLERLARLVDRSLVTMREAGGAARYALLETVRQYAAERLRARGEEEALRRRHAACFAALVADAEPHLITAGRRPWLERVHAEIDNLRQALAWTRDADPEAHLELAGRLCWFWFSTGFWSEGRGWSERALALPGAERPTPARAAALFAAAVIATLQADTAAAHGWLDECLAIARAAGDARRVAYASTYQAMVLIQQGRADGEALAEEAIAHFQAHGDLYGLRLALLILATSFTSRGDFERALGLLHEAVAVARRFGLPRELGIALQVLGWAVLRQGDAAGAAGLFRESLVALRQDPQQLFLARGLEMVAAALASAGPGRDAARLFGAGEAVRERIGAAMFETDRQGLAPRIAAVRARVGDDAFAAAWADGKRLSLDEALDLAIAQEAAPATPAAEAPAGPVLSVRALGPLEVSLGEVRLDGDAWSSAKAKELLVYLLCHPAGRTREQIGLDFWPDASAAQVKNSFHVLLHRLRKALGRADVVIVEDDRYRINPGLAPWFDAEALDRDARAAPKDPERLARAVALYRGDLLAGEVAGDWHLAHADRLRLRHHEALSALADLRLAAGDLPGATEALERLTDADDLREDACRRLMVCYARAGQRERALQRYDRLAAALRGELGASPERATVTLRDRIRRAEQV